MNKLFTLTTAAVLVTTAMTGAAHAQTAAATATTELNIRSGPGPQFEAVGFIASGDSVTVEGCLDASKWCRVSYNGVTGWSYSDYLTADRSGAVVESQEAHIASLGFERCHKLGG